MRPRSEPLFTYDDLPPAETAQIEINPPHRLKWIVCIPLALIVGGGVVAAVVMK